MGAAGPIGRSGRLAYPRPKPLLSQETVQKKGNPVAVGWYGLAGVSRFWDFGWKLSLPISTKFVKNKVSGGGSRRLRARCRGIRRCRRWTQIQEIVKRLLSYGALKGFSTSSLVQGASAPLVSSSEVQCLRIGGHLRNLRIRTWRSISPGRESHRGKRTLAAAPVVPRLDNRPGIPNYSGAPMSSRAPQWRVKAQPRRPFAGRQAPCGDRQEPRIY